jgi:hypothetical protein
MSGFIDSLEVDLLEHVFGIATYTAPSDWYVGLSTTTPSDDGTGFTEPTDGYSRVSVTADGTEWSVVSGDPAVLDNDNPIVFATATGDWGTVTHWGLFTGVAASAGTPQMFAALNTAKRIATDDAARFAAGDLDMKLGDPGDTF